MKFAFPLALGLVLGTVALPACAQMLPGMGASNGPTKLQPKMPAPDLAPAGLPGVGGGAPLATGPNLQKPMAGDPTQALFAAINNNDYAAAQDAVSRGANLQALNQFDETPLDLAIALNRNDITFMLLGTRNELAAQGGAGGEVMGAPWTLGETTKSAKEGKRHASSPVVTVREISKIPMPAGSNNGTPDPQAGFLGFNPKG